MAELGGTSRASHEDIGEYAARVSDPGLAVLIAVGEEAEPLLAGARRVRSWPGEALAVPDWPAAPRSSSACQPAGSPETSVLVRKASRAAHLEGCSAVELPELLRSG